MTTPWPAHPPRPAWWPSASPRWAACCTASSWTMPRWARGSGRSGLGAQWQGREAPRDRPPRVCRAHLTEAIRAISQADRTTSSVTEPPPARPAVGRPALPSGWGEGAHRPGRERGCSKGSEVTPEPGVGWGGRKGQEGRGEEGRGGEERGVGRRGAGGLLPSERPAGGSISQDLSGEGAARLPASTGLEWAPGFRGPHPDWCPNARSATAPHTRVTRGWCPLSHPRRRVSGRPPGGQAAV